MTPFASALATALSIALSADEQASARDVRALLDGREAQGARCQAPYDDARCALAALVRKAQTGTGRELVAALAERRIDAAVVWETRDLLDRADSAGGAPIDARVLLVLRDRALHGDCAASEALLQVVRAGQGERKDHAAGAAWRVVASAPDAVRACWTTFRELAPEALRLRVACVDRDRALAAYATCVCRSEACRQMTRLLERQECAGPGAPAAAPPPTCPP